LPEDENEEIRQVSKKLSENGKSKISTILIV
jgi:hypothetical protein